MGKLTIWHNPRCGKSRQTLALIEGSGNDIEIVQYLEAPPTPEILDATLILLDMQPRQLMRKKEAPYRELNLSAEELGRSALIAAMVEHPILIERPVVIRGNRAILGRPPENVLALLD